MNAIVTTPALSFRLYEEKYLDGVLQLWEKYSGWGAITKQDFEDWYLNTPYGPCIVILAVDEAEKVVGQLVLIPSRVYLQGREVKALRASSPVIADTIRQTNLRSGDHPFIGMTRYAIPVAQSKEYELVYFFPAHGWTALLRLFPHFNLPLVAIATYDCFSISLEDAANYKASSINEILTVKVIEQGFTEEYNRLWEESVSSMPISCGVIRQEKWLAWKLGGYQVLEVRNHMSGELKGYMAIKKESGLLVDMLARTKDDLVQVMEAVIASVHYLNPHRGSLECKEIQGMYTPLLQSVLQSMEVEKKDYTFAFGCFALDNSIHLDSIQPDAWYMMPND
jgi:hypothetical protein